MIVKHVEETFETTHYLINNVTKAINSKNIIKQKKEVQMNKVEIGKLAENSLTHSHNTSPINHYN